MNSQKDVTVYPSLPDSRRKKRLKAALRRRLPAVLHVSLLCQIQSLSLTVLLSSTV